jgi:uncharacterized C2H2 Zn-finger protein
MHLWADENVRHLRGPPLTRKVSMEELERDSKLWFKPYCRACGLLFDNYKEYIEHCANEHWKSRWSENPA